MAFRDSFEPSAGGGGVTDHGALTGLADDDHPHYFDLTNEARNLIMSGGGDISWGVVANKLKWTQAFRLMPLPLDVVNPDRNLFFPMPTSGVTDHLGAERASADGITLDSYDSLWVVHVRGGAYNVGNSWKVIPNNNELLDTYFDDENAYLMAVRNSDAGNNAVYLRNGVVVPSGRVVKAGKAIPDVTDADVAAANKDGVAGTASLRTLGTGAQQATPGDHQSAADPHTQYHTDARGDARYKQLANERVAERPATDAASTYPLGVSIMDVATVAGWPAATGTVETLRYSDGRTVQFFAQKNGTLVRMRWWNEVSAAWSSFATPNVADFASASHVGSRDGHPLATTTLDGMMAAGDKSKLEGLGSSTKPLLRLNYKSTTDIAGGTGVVLTAGAWTNLGPQHSFSLEAAVSLTEIVVGGYFYSGGIASVHSVYLRFLLDGSTAIGVGGSVSPANGYGTLTAGTHPVYLENLAAGAHTLQVQCSTNTTGSKMFCQSATAPNEFLRVEILEHK